MNESNQSTTNNDTQWKCTVCGRVGRVGRCCGTDTRIPLNELARQEYASEIKKMKQTNEKEGEK